MRKLTAVDPHVVTSELEEGRDVLEDEAEGVGLPIVCVVREQDAALDVDVDVLQEGPVHSSADGVCLVLGEDNMAAVIAVVEGCEDMLRVVGHSITMRLHHTNLVAFRRVGDRESWLIWGWADGRPAGEARFGCCCRSQSSNLQDGGQLHDGGLV